MLSNAEDHCENSIDFEMTRSLKPVPRAAAAYGRQVKIHIF